MRFTHEISFIAPIQHVETARSVSRAFDPDIGGYGAFQMMLSESGNEPATHVAYNTPCSDSFLQFLELPTEQIHALVVADYEKRWSDIEPPTLEAVTAFMNTLIYEVDKSFLQVINDNNLSVISVSD